MTFKEELRNELVDAADQQNRTRRARLRAWYNMSDVPLDERWPKLLRRWQWFVWYLIALTAWDLTWTFVL